METIRNYNQDGKCTAPVNREHMCKNYQPDPFERRKLICVFRQDGDCKHSMDEVCRLNGGDGFEA